MNCNLCDRRIIWATDPEGRKVAFDPEPAADGGHTLLTDGKTYTCRPATEGEPTRFRHHAKTCPFRQSGRVRAKGLATA